MCLDTKEKNISSVKLSKYNKTENYIKDAWKETQCNNGFSGKICMLW